MKHATPAILVVDTNPETRGILASQLASSGCDVVQARDGRDALEMLRGRRFGLVVTELYLDTGESRCLVQTIRQERMRGTRTIAFTKHATSTDRDWAKRWGAKAFLIQPSTPERVQHVVSRLLAQSTTRSTTVARGISRRETLNVALGDIERGELHDTLAIIFGRPWWDELAESQRSEYRKRARRAGVTLRSDAMMSREFVEVRCGSRPAGARAAKQSPYRG